MKAIIFDLDGTLIDSQEDILASFGKAFEGLGLPLPPRERLVGVIGKRLEDCFLGFVGGDEARADRGARLFRAWYEGHYMDATRPYPGVDVALRGLAAQLPLAVCTMKKAEFARRLVTAFGWEGLVAQVLGSEEGFPAKPDPAMFLELCRRLETGPAETLYVGDTALDARMALAAGAPFAFAAYGYGPRESLDGLPISRVLNGPGDLASLWRRAR